VIVREWLTSMRIFGGTAITLELEASPVEQGTPSDRMDESSDSNTDEGTDDIMPGCGVLHFDNPLIRDKSFWVRVSVSILGETGIVLTKLVG
jgi:hypothetical protein